VALCALFLTVSLEAGAEAVQDAFHGKIVKLRGNRIVLFYDFSHEDQLKDFEVRGPKGLLQAPQPLVRIDQGRLVLERTTALTFRRASRGRLRARFTLSVHARHNLGAFFSGPREDGPFLLITLFDHRFREEHGLLMSACEAGSGTEPLRWRELCNAKPGALSLRFARENAVDVELSKDGHKEFCRIGSLYRVRTSEQRLQDMDTYRFGLWVEDSALSIDDLTLTLELADTEGLDLAFKGDARYAERTEGQLVRVVKDAPLSAEAKGALRELSRRGPDGWNKMFSLIKRLGRKQPYAVLPAVRALGDGDEKERAEMLLRLYPKKGPADLQMAVLRAMVPFYPLHKELLHAGLKVREQHRLEYFRELVYKDLPSDVVRRYLKDDELGAEAFEILTDRNVQLTSMGNVPVVWAREANSPAAARAILRDFTEEPNWTLIDGLVSILNHKEARVARGAYLLLLTLSGKDLPPDKDYWNSWIAAKRDSFQPPHLASPGSAAAAILRSIEFLRKDLLEDGLCTWPVNPDWPGTQVGATALAIYALRSAGVPASDAAIQAGLRTLVHIDSAGAALRSDLQGYTYALALSAMALRAVDAERFKPQLKIIAKRLSDGQLENGQWTYYCKSKNYARRPRAGDNSNTQYAILALRGCWRSGIKVEPEIWQRNAEFWRKNQNRHGGWGYGPGGTTMHELSMTTAGVASVAICMEAMHGNEATQKVRSSKRVGAGMRRLGELLLEHGYEDQETYAFYGVERACILTGIRAFNDYDWYHEGAAILIGTQKESGAWGSPGARGIATGAGYGEAIDTSYALLFLKRAVTGLPGAGGGGVLKVPGVRARKKSE